VQLGFGHSEGRPNSFIVFCGSRLSSQKTDGFCKTLLCLLNNDGVASFGQELLSVSYVQPQSRNSNKFILLSENNEMTPKQSLNLFI
jgi:hypothetical protein